jgi:hypothetical protein
MAVATVFRMLNTFDPVPKFLRRMEKAELSRKLMQYGETNLQANQISRKSASACRCLPPNCDITLHECANNKLCLSLAETLGPWTTLCIPWPAMKKWLVLPCVG